MPLSTFMWRMEWNSEWKRIVLLFVLMLIFLLIFVYAVSNKGSLVEDENRFLDLIEKSDGIYLQHAKIALRESREFILKAVQMNGLSLQFAPKRFLNDREICLSAVEENGKAIEFVGNRFRNDKELFFVAAKQEICYHSNFLFSLAGSELHEDKEFVLEVVKGDTSSLKIVSKEFRNDFDVVLQAAKSDGSCLQYVTNEEIFDNEEIVITAIQSDGCSLKYMKEHFRRDKSIVLEAVKKCPYSLEFAHEDLKRDKEVVMEFFGRIAYYYEGYDLTKINIFPNGLSEELKNDEDVALKIIFSTKSVNRLNLISEELLHNEDFIWKILNYRDGSPYRDFSILMIIPEEFRGRMDIVSAAHELDHTTYPSQDTLSYASEEIRSNKDSILNEHITYFSYREFQDVSEELRGDKEVVLKFVQKRGASLKFASEVLRCDREVVIAAVRSDGSAIEYACKELQNDPKICIQAAKSRGLRFVPKKFQDDKELVIEAIVRSRGSELRSASERLKDDKEVVLKAVKEGGVYALTFASERMQNDREVVFEAVKKSKSFSLNTKGIVISDKFRNDENFVMDVLKQENVGLSFDDFKKRYERGLRLSIGKRREFYRGSLCSYPLQCYAADEWFNLRDYKIGDAFEIMRWWKRFRFLKESGGRLRRDRVFLERFLTSFRKTKYSGLCDLIYDRRFESRINKLFVRMLGEKRFFEIVQSQFGCSLDYVKEKRKGDQLQRGFEIFSW